MSGDAPVRRVVAVLVVYAGGAWIVLRLGDWLRRVLMLPPLFDTLLRAGLLVGVVVAAALAWSYPRLAVGDGSDGEGRAGDGERRE